MSQSVREYRLRPLTSGFVAGRLTGATHGRPRLPPGGSHLGSQEAGELLKQVGALSYDPRVPRYVERPIADAAGLRDDRDLPWQLPYNLQARAVFQTIEDLYEMLHEINGRLHDMGYDRLEELLDPAGFSGLVSRSVVDRFERFWRALVRNRYHNGYPDLLPRGAYSGDAVQHGNRGGLEVKASRYDSGWQAHGPRAGWFCVVQFDLDRDITKALHDREPTIVRAVFIAELEEADWSWQPAAEGRIRSGTASIRASGEAKLRLGAVWVDPEYEPAHQARLQAALLGAFSSQADELVHAVLAGAGEPLRVRDIAEQVAAPARVAAEALRGRVDGALRRLIRDGRARRVRPGVFEST